MYLIQDLESHVLETPYSEGYRHLRVLSGYVSPIFIEHVLETYNELNLEVTVGMVPNDGLSTWQHWAFLRLMHLFTDRLSIFYQVSRPGNHRKVYHWQDPILETKVFIGSANFTKNGFGRQREILVESTCNNIDEIFSDLDVIRCDNADVEEQVSLYKVLPRRVVAPASPTSTGEHPHEVVFEPAVVEVLSTPTHTYNEYVDISLVDKRTGEVPAKSGLNWGQREGRNHNQAYLSVKGVHGERPDFFPPLKAPFIMITDDGENLVCVMAQANRKAIHTRENNSIMGAYFRRRLGLLDGAFVVTDDLVRYGRNSVRIYKIDDETYYMDFSV
ncbi:restriction endonuclease PLD domain-containing protein [Lysinibacillus tabacifolii]|uniref:NgoFVII family restriction endonuclease n=1 Tax=Lysinibacillus tabacifolii TaxID=1173107 RepID=A0ABY2SYW1_9BACI|nr:restriction endonuclease PLD domain-containing protein [Lysinibacillus tabacifolii]TKI46248.1 NgoFVII family restriction endonuclease [Lysinibacillus tabacifolii]